MHRCLLTIAACCAALSAQPGSSDLTCVLTVGEIAYPPYNGASASRNDADRDPIGRRMVALLPSSRSDANEFGREAQRSVLASIYDQACQGRKLVLIYRFRLAGDEAERRDVEVRKEQNRIVVTARPAHAALQFADPDRRRCSRHTRPGRRTVK